MLRVKIGAKFPSNLSPASAIDLLYTIVYQRLETSGYLPEASEIQRHVKNICEDRCTRQFYVHVWISNQQQMTTSLRRSEYKPPNKKRLTKKTKDMFDRLPKIKTKEVCSICLKKGFTGVKLKCGHVFHKKCIKKACQYDKRCPNCRTSITV